MSEKKSRAATIGRQLLQGLTFNTADEMSDTLAAGMASAILMGDSGRSFPDEFKKNFQQLRAQSQADIASDWEDMPVTSFASQAVGSLPMGLTKAAVNAGNWVRGGTALQGFGRGAAVGAGYGAASGLGAAGDTFEDRLGGATTGAAIGGLVGGATAPLARMGRAPDNIDYRKVTAKTASKATSKAEQKLFRDLAARPNLEDQLARARSMDVASRNTGIDLTLAEKVAQSQSDPLLAYQKLLGQNPATAGRMEALYAARSGTPNQAGQIESVLQRQAQELAGGLGSYDEVAGSLINKADAAAKRVTKGLVEKANPLYEQAFSKKVPPSNFAKLRKDQPIIENAIKAALQDERFSASLAGKPENSIEVIDAAKRIIDEKIKAGASPMQPFDTRAYKAAQSQLLDLADQYAPSYAQARQIYSGNPEALQMRSSIGSVADIDPLQAQQVASKLFSGTQQNAKLAAQALGPEGARQAAAARILNVMDTARGDPTSFATKIAPDARTMNMLRTYAGGNQLNETLDVINQAKIGEKFRYGSPTQPLEQAQQGLEQAANASFDLMTGGKTSVMRKIGQAVADKFNMGEDPRFYQELAEIMTTPRGMDLLERVAMGQQQAIQELQSVSPTLQRIGQAAATSAPVPRAVVGGAVGPTQQAVPQIPIDQDDFSDFDAILQQPQMDDFSDLDALLQGSETQSFTTEMPMINAPLLERVAMAESSGNPNARNPASSATGLYQFTDPTWRGMVRNYGAQTGITEADKNNPQAQRIMAELLMQENARAYQQAGMQPSEADLYAAHFLGAPAAVKAKSNPQAYGAQLFPEAARANPTIFYAGGRPRTNAEINALLGQKIGVR